MNTFLKLALLTLLVVVAVHLWPILVAPFVVIGLVALVLGAITAGGVAVVLSVAMALIGVLLAVVLSLTAALSPIWIPAVLILGLISLAKKKPAVAS